MTAELPADLTVVRGDSAPTLSWALSGANLTGSDFTLVVTIPGLLDILSSPTRPYGGLTGQSGQDVTLTLSTQAGDLQLDQSSGMLTWRPSQVQVASLGDVNFYTLTRVVQGGESSQVASGRIFASRYLGSGPTTAAVAFPGPQGPPGQTGPAGPPGPDFTGFGYVQYTAMSDAQPVQLTPGVRTQVVMDVDPTQTTMALKGPFAGFQFWDGQTLRARASGDAYRVRLTLTATAAVAGGSLVFDAAVTGLSATTDTDTESLTYPAGSPQRSGCKLDLYPKSVFVAAGAKIFVTSTVPVSLSSEVLVVSPANAGP